MTQEERAKLEAMYSRLKAIAGQAPAVATYNKGAADRGYGPKVGDVANDLRALLDGNKPSDNE